MRLDRFLSNAHAGTRSQVKKLVKDGRVKVNGITAETSSMQINENTDSITLDDEPVVFARYCYYMLNKPAGYISATEGNVPLVMDLIHENDSGMFPCGRLDKDTEGLLLITNDGPLAHKLLSPKHHVEKEYFVELALPVSEDDIRRMSEGITYGGESYQPSVYKPHTEYSGTIILKEGKYHEIKEIFKSLGNHVTYLKRIRMKNLVLDTSLKPGEYRPLTEAEINDLKA